VIFYVVDAKARAVVIERVIHGHMDIDSDDFDA
jgi:plasmid stabilization system protein ParE